MLDQKKTLYDIINSEELELLYKKNSHLLERLSKTGKENTQLYIELSSIRKERSTLGNRNIILKKKYQSLKDQISVFARQHREFNSQSQKLKRELEQIKSLPERKSEFLLPSTESLKQKERAFFEKKEQVYKSQIQNLQNINKKLKEEQNTDVKILQINYTNQIQVLEEKLREIESGFRNEKSQIEGKFVLKVKGLNEVNQFLEKKCKSLEQSLAEREKSIQEILKDKKEMKVFLKDRESRLDLMEKKMIKEREEIEGKFGLKVKGLNEVNQSLEKKCKGLEQSLAEREKSIQEILKDKKEMKVFLKDRESRLDLMEKKMIKEREGIEGKFGLKVKGLNEVNQSLEKKCKGLEQSLAEREKSIQEIRNQNKSFQKNQESVEKYKNQIVDLREQKELIKSDFIHQLGCFAKERELLKFQSAQMQKAISAGKLGFDQAMISVHKKYRELYKNYDKMKKDCIEAKKEKKIFSDQLSRSKKQFMKDKEELEFKIKKEKDRKIKELSGEVQSLREGNQSLENQIQYFKKKARSLFEKEKKQIQEEAHQLFVHGEKNLSRLKEKHLEEITNLKMEYEDRIKNMEVAFDKRNKHLRIEMENDLCGERKRYEVFKEIKSQESREIKAHLVVFQQEAHKLKSKTAILEKNLSDNQKQFEKYFQKSKKEENQNHKLKSLCRDLQKENEAKIQQIESLQKLNRALSLSLNKSQNSSEKPLDFERVEDFTEFHVKKGVDLKKESNPILADIHFD